MEKIMATKFLDSILMLTFGKKKVEKKKNFMVQRNQ